MSFQSASIAALVESPFNHRTHFDEDRLRELADSVKKVNIIEPLIVRPAPAKQYDIYIQFEIVCGARRFRAAKLAGLSSVPVLVRDLTDEEVIAIQLIENIQREDVSPIEEATGLARLKTEFGYTIEMLMEKTGKSRSHVYNTLKLLNLTPEPQELVKSGAIGRELAGLIAVQPKGLHKRALKLIKIKDEHGGTRWASYREAKAILTKENLFIPIASAKFDTSCPQLAKQMGACHQCPHLSTNEPTLAEALGPDVCTDRECFDSKTKAHIIKVSQGVRDAGGFVLEGEEADKAKPYAGANWFLNHTATDEEVRDGSDYRPLNEVIEEMQAKGKATPTIGLHVDSQTLTTTHVVSKEGLDQVRAYLAEKNPAPEHQEAPAKKERVFRSELHRQAFDHVDQIRMAARTACLKSPRQGEEARLLAASLLAVADEEGVTPELTDHFGWTAELEAAEIETYEHGDWIIKHKLGRLTLEDCARIAVYLALQDAPFGRHHDDDFPDQAIHLASVYELDIDAIATAAQAEDDADDEQDDSDDEGQDTPQAEPQAPVAAWPAPKPSSSRPGVKYRNPETGETWTGRGLKPKWVQAALESGKTLDDFEVTPHTTAEA